MSSSTESPTVRRSGPAPIQQRAAVEFVQRMVGACVLYIHLAGATALAAGAEQRSPNATDLLDSGSSHGESGIPMTSVGRTMTLDLDAAVANASWDAAMAHLRASGVDPNALLERAAQNLRSFEAGDALADEPEDDA